MEDQKEFVKFKNKFKRKKSIQLNNVWPYIRREFIPPAVFNMEEEQKKLNELYTEHLQV